MKLVFCSFLIRNKLVDSIHIEYAHVIYQKYMQDDAYRFVEVNSRVFSLSKLSQCAAAKEQSPHLPTHSMA